jgi:sugar phosphate isomerase/epimerase
MNHLPVAVQVYSVREDAQKDFKGTLQQIKDMGYDGVELAGLYKLAPSDVKRALDEVGIPAISAHVPYELLTKDTEKTIDDYIIIGCQYIVIPYLVDDLRPGSPNFDNVLKEIERIGKVCKSKGVTLLYHNHDFEFVRMQDGSYGLDAIYSAISSEYLQTQLDTCWIKVAGEDPVKYIEKYANRSPVVHVKDFYKEGMPQDMYELIGIETEKKEEVPKGFFEFRPVGYGMQNVPAILEATLKAGARWIVVEQDSSNDRTPMEAIRMSREYLRKLGW